MCRRPSLVRKPHPFPTLLTVLVGILLAATCLPATAQILVFQQELLGGMTRTGNTIGLDKEINANGPGTAGSLGTFITTDTNQQDLAPANPGNPWYAGTTNSWQLQSSAAVLDLPEGATVARAQLVWGASWLYLEDVSAYLDDAVTLTYEAESSTSAAPDPSLSVTLAEISGAGFFEVNYYLRSADVTEYVALHGAGVYEVGGIPGTQSELINSRNAGGWTLYVVYELNSEPMRNVQLQIAGEYIDELNDATLLFADFTTFDTEPLHAMLFVDAMEGDANLTGDQLLLRDPSDVFVALSHATRPADNVFISNISGDDGFLDTRGTFGNQNHAAGTPSLGGRQGWDTAALALSSEAGLLVPGQDSLELRAASSGDDYVLCAVGLSMDVAYAIADGVELNSRRVYLSDAVPNPFNPRTTISYSVPQAMHVELVVYDLAGRHVRTLVEGPVGEGPHETTWSGTDDEGARVASGVYLYQLRAGEILQTKRMVLLK